MAHKMKLEGYHLSLTHGFLPSTPPLLRLPAYYEPWEALCSDLHPLRVQQKLGSRVAQLPSLTTAYLVNNSEWRRAYVILGFIASAYIWGAQKPLEVRSQLFRNIQNTLNSTASARSNRSAIGGSGEASGYASYRHVRRTEPVELPTARPTQGQLWSREYERANNIHRLRGWVMVLRPTDRHRSSRRTYHIARPGCYIWGVRWQARNGDESSATNLRSHRCLGGFAPQDVWEMQTRFLLQRDSAVASGYNRRRARNRANNLYPTSRRMRYKSPIMALIWALPLVFEADLAKETVSHDH